MENENKHKRELNAVTKKVLIILGLALVLTVPLSQVENQINSRREYETLAQKEVAKGWGENVTFGSPVVSASERNMYADCTSESISLYHSDMIWPIAM